MCAPWQPTRAVRRSVQDARPSRPRLLAGKVSPRQDVAPFPLCRCHLSPPSRALSVRTARPKPAGPRRPPGSLLGGAPVPPAEVPVLRLGHLPGPQPPARRQGHFHKPSTQLQGSGHCTPEVTTSPAQDTNGRAAQTSSRMSLAI